MLEQNNKKGSNWQANKFFITSNGIVLFFFSSSAKTKQKIFSFAPKSLQVTGGDGRVENS